MRNQQPQNSHELLPLEGNLAIYTRKAAATKFDQQEDNQIIALVACAQQAGWCNERIIVFAYDDGQPGNTPLMERPGGQALLTAITQERIKALLIADEHRLFRHAASRGIDLFIELCRSHEVFVMTLRTTYDFRNPAHVQRFRFVLEARGCTFFSRMTVGKRYRPSQRANEASPTQEL